MSGVALSQKLSQIFYNNHHLRCNEEDYKFIVMKDGIVLSNEFEYFGTPFGLVSFDFSDFTDEQNEIYRKDALKLNDIIIQAQGNALTRIKTEKEEKEAKELAEKQKKLEENKKRQEENELKTYERLKKKFETTTD